MNIDESKELKKTLGVKKNNIKEALLCDPNGGCRSHQRLVFPKGESNDQLIRRIFWRHIQRERCCRAAYAKSHNFKGV